MRTPLAQRLAVATIVRRAFRTLRLVCLSLAFFTSACSRASSKGEPPPSTTSPSSAASRAPRPARSTPAVERKPLAAPVTPNVPPQLVACGERDFYRITGSALQVFEIAKELPPPNIRGSRIAVQTNESTVEEPSNVILLTKGALVIAKGGVLRYEPEQKRALRHAPIQASAPLVVWPDPRRADSFRVRAAGDEKIGEFSLPGLPSGDAGAPAAPARAARRVEALPAFDGHLFTVLADGTPFYSTTKGLVRRGRESRPSPLPVSSPATILFADSSPDRHWTADASGRLALFDQKQGEAPIVTSNVRGVVIDAALAGDEVAVLGMDTDGQSYRPTVVIFSNGKERARLEIGPSFTRTPPELDLCLIAGHPWVLVGSKRWMQLIDWESGRLLAEW
jgi:hypothetical protein